MKYFVYVALALVAGVLFLPHGGTTEIRNLPLLILILSFIFVLVLIRCFKYLLLMAKTKKLLGQNKMKLIQSSFFPWASSFHGQYSIIFQYEHKTVQLILMLRKRKYQRYHFESINELEFYRSNRVVFNSIKTKGAVISKLVETNRVGKQAIKWNDSAESRVILFDKLPDQITDSVKREHLGVEDRICDSNVYLLDWFTFCKHMNMHDEILTWLG